MDREYLRRTVIISDGHKGFNTFWCWAYIPELTYSSVLKQLGEFFKKRQQDAVIKEMTNMYLVFVHS